MKLIGIVPHFLFLNQILWFWAFALYRNQPKPLPLSACFYLTGNHSVRLAKFDLNLSPLSNLLSEVSKENDDSVSFTDKCTQHIHFRMCDKTWNYFNAIYVYFILYLLASAYPLKCLIKCNGGKKIIVNCLLAAIHIYPTKPIIGTYSLPKLETMKNSTIEYKRKTLTPLRANKKMCVKQCMRDARVRSGNSENWKTTKKKTNEKNWHYYTTALNATLCRTIELNRNVDDRYAKNRIK